MRLFHKVRLAFERLDSFASCRFGDLDTQLGPDQVCENVRKRPVALDARRKMACLCKNPTGTFFA